jgi:hypothetical protein
MFARVSRRRWRRAVLLITQICGQKHAEADLAAKNDKSSLSSVSAANHSNARVIFIASRINHTSIYLRHATQKSGEVTEEKAKYIKGDRRPPRRRVIQRKTTLNATQEHTQRLALPKMPRSDDKS